MNNVIHITPSKWVTESLLCSITGLRPGTIKRAREKSWMQGREYLLISPEGEPKVNSECMYNREAIDLWIEQQSKRQPGTAKLKKSA